MFSQQGVRSEEAVIIKLQDSFQVTSTQLAHEGETGTHQSMLDKDDTAFQPLPASAWCTGHLCTWPLHKRSEEQHADLHKGKYHSELQLPCRHQRLRLQFGQLDVQL